MSVSLPILNKALIFSPTLK